jgi:hypothetical protein
VEIFLASLQEAPPECTAAGPLSYTLAYRSSFEIRNRGAIRPWKRCAFSRISSHEIGHLLLPPATYSPIGIMRERWTNADFKAMATGNLAFTGEQTTLIRNEVSRLSQR